MPRTKRILIIDADKPLIDIIMEWCPACNISWWARPVTSKEVVINL